MQYTGRDTLRPPSPLTADRTTMTAIAPDFCRGAPENRFRPAGIDRPAIGTATSWCGCRRPGSTAAENAADLIAALRDLIGAGAITPAIERTYPLAEAASATAHLRDGPGGNLVISVSHRSAQSPDPGSTP